MAAVDTAAVTMEEVTAGEAVVVTVEDTTTVSESTVQSPLIVLVDLFS